MSSAIRVVIVRHGESTYNIEKRIQGRLDRSELTARGVEQANCVRQALAGLSFDLAYVSPLRRAQQTANEILKETPEVSPDVTPLLYEIDLSAWEGIRFDDLKTQAPDQHYAWRHCPQDLELNGRYPVRDVWQQARDFWQYARSQPLPEPVNGDRPTILVVGHSGINRSLIGTALGLNSEAYARIGQNNCAISVLNFPQGWDGPVQLESLNLTAHLGICLPPKTSGVRLLLVRHGETEWNRQQRFQGQRDIPLNENGRLQAQQAAAFLKEIPLNLAFSSPLKRPWETAMAILNERGDPSNGRPQLSLEAIADLQEISHGEWEGLYEHEIKANYPGQLDAWQSTPASVQMPAGENLDRVWARSRSAWQQIVRATESHAANADALVVAHDAVNKAIVSQLFDLDPTAFWYFKQGNGAVTVIDYPYGAAEYPILRSLNITSHIGGVIDCTAAGAL
ncbi:MAG: histidine phosphatase family protein [Cyanobacteria bacterium P01_F01_bin.33]